MKIIQLGVLAGFILAMANLTSCGDGSGDSGAAIDTFSYSYGVMIWEALSTEGLSSEEFEAADFQAGLLAVLGDETPTMDLQQAQKLTQDRRVSGTPAKKEDKLGYAYGVLVANNIQQLEVAASEFDGESLQMGMQDNMTGDSTNLKIKTTEAEQHVTSFFKSKQEAFMQAMQAKAAKNLQEGQAFLAENAKKEGVQMTESGLQYEVLQEGDGPKPTVEDKVKVHYHGTLMDGTVFDSSVDRGEPVSFPVSGVIPGWTEALQLMPVGSKWKLYIPAKLAYGERGAGAKIPPNATLMFEVELLGIEEAEG